jgi:hypothetical protein
MKNMTRVFLVISSISFIGMCALSVLCLGSGDVAVFVAGVSFPATVFSFFSVRFLWKNRNSAWSHFTNKGKLFYGIQAPVTIIFAICSVGLFLDEFLRRFFQTSL